MRKRLKERLKDIIIDHINDYCYNEVVQKIEGGTASLTLDAGSKIKDDPVLQPFYDFKIKSQGPIKMYFTVRNATHCQVIEGNMILKSFSEKLLSQGFKKSDKLSTFIEDALKTLVHRSYLARNLPKKVEFALTHKGINHYTSGRSFEDL